MARKLSRREVAQYVANQLVAGASPKKMTLQLAAYLIESRRTNELTIMIRDIAMYLSDAGHVSGTITSARELNAATKKAIEHYAKEKTGAAHIELDTIVDEAVLGGIKLEVPGREFDSTVARQLTLLTTRYKKA